MKKTLSLLLVLAMVLSSFGFAFAAEDEVNPAEFLNEKGILKGNASGDLMLEDNLKRQDMVVMLSRLLGEEDEAKAFEGETSFTDIADKFYVPYIAWAEAKELTEGVGDNKFGFDRAVKENEVVAFMLRALGYTDVKWEDVPAKAVELGLVAKDADLDKDAKRSVLAELTYKALGMKMKDSEKTLAEHLEIELPVPAKLEVKEVVADNLKEIKVVFNKAVDESVLDTDNYETDAGEIVDIAYDEDANMAILELEEAMDNKEDYEITINVEKLDVTKEFTAYDNTVPVVEDVVALGTKAVKVIMSEPIVKANISEFKLDGKTLYGTTEIIGREIVVKPYKTLEAKEYELTVGRLEDYAEFKSVESKHTFEVVEDSEKPVVEEVSATLESAVITFSEDIDKATVSRYNVYHGSKVYPESATKIAGNKVLVVFTADKALPVYETTLYVSGFADYSGNKMDAAEVKVKPSVDESRPEVLKAELQKDLKTIEIKFSKSVKKEDAEDVSNYTVLDPKDNKVTIAEAKADGRIVELVLGKELSENKEYTLKISGIRDNNKYPNVMFVYEGKISVGDVSSPVFEYVSGSSELDDDSELYVTKAHLFFSKDMDLGTLSNPENYLVKLSDGTVKLLSDVKGEIDIIKGDGKVVLLNAKTKLEIKEVGVLGVKDTTGKKISNYGDMKDIETKDFEVLNATAEAKDTVVVEFSIPVEKAPRAAFTFDTTANVKEVEIDGEYVTLKLENKIKADATDLLTIADEEIVAFNGKKLAKQERVELTDEIAPSISKVEAKLNDDKTKVDITVTFDEELGAIVKETAKTDLVVKALNGDAKITKYDLTGNKEVLTISIDINEVKVDTAFEVSVVKGARFIKDKADVANAAKETSERSSKVTGIKDLVAQAQAAVDAEAAKITEITAPEADAESLTMPTVADGYTVAIKSSNNEAVIALDGTITPPADETTVKLVLTVTHTASGVTADTVEIEVTVPATAGAGGR